MTVEDPFLGRGASLLRAGLGTVTAVSIEGKAAGSLRAGGGGGRLATVVSQSTLRFRCSVSFCTQPMRVCAWADQSPSGCHRPVEDGWG